MAFPKSQRIPEDLEQCEDVGPDSKRFVPRLGT